MPILTLTGISLVRVQVLPKFGVALGVLVALLLFVPFKTIAMVFRLDRKILTG